MTLFTPLRTVEVDVVCEFEKPWRTFCHIPPSSSKKFGSWPFSKDLPPLLNIESQLRSPFCLNTIRAFPGVHQGLVSLLILPPCLRKFELHFHETRVCKALRIEHFFPWLFLSLSHFSNLRPMTPVLICPPTF